FWDLRLRKFGSDKISIVLVEFVVISSPIGDIDLSDGDKAQSAEDCITKKVRLKEQGIEPDVGMAVDPNLDPPLSWKERLVGKGFVESKNGNVVASLGVEDYFDFEDGDIKRSFVNGIPLIVFSERVQHLLVKDMADTGPWVIYGQYLTVQPWTIDFNPAQPYPSVVMSWIHFPGLPGHMYNRKILWDIEAMVGKVTKLDFKTDV
ncbi:hypothetical protein Goarm_018938, partial [Gossypium armourianum]|nr:hypothetical protein [Gossypium armourianum]